MGAPVLGEATSAAIAAARPFSSSSLGFLVDAPGTTREA